MSTISEIYASYQRALTQSREQYTDLYTERAENGRRFYDQFFHKLIVPFRPMFENANSRAALTRHVERFFGTNQIDFVAIDGTCQKDPFTDFVVFFGGAYGAKGRISFEGDPPRVKYQKWDINRDVSMVAWIPVPFAELSDVAGSNVEERFIVSDAERVNLASIHTSLMQLAEIYLAYNSATASTIESPRLIMLDQSLSGIMAAASHGANTALAGYPYDRRKLDEADITIALAHPFHAGLRIPSTKQFRRYTAVLAEFDRRKSALLPLSTLEQSLGLSRSELNSTLKFLTGSKAHLAEMRGESLALLVDCRESWQYTVSLFQNICTRLFVRKDPSALIYNVPNSEDETLLRQRWMAPDDIAFLIAVGLRALIEACWEKRILLVGVVKDSDSRYFSRNYLGAMKHVGVYPQLRQNKVGLLPWTDRIYLESIPMYCDEQLEAPWASIEFDSTFMTLHLGTDDKGNERVMGVPVQGGEMVAPERLFLRSLAQFYLNREKSTPLTGHVVFLDRLAFPGWDTVTPQICLESTSLGKINPISYRDRDVDNVGQAIMMYFLSTVTRNHFPEVIGYPDPLHQADWGAKSMGERVKAMIASSELPFQSQPIAKTLRRLRDERRR